MILYNKSWYNSAKGNIIKKDRVKNGNRKTIRREVQEVLLTKSQKALHYQFDRHSKNFCVKANPIKQKTACAASVVMDFLLTAILPQSETVCAPQA